MINFLATTFMVLLLFAIIEFIYRSIIVQHPESDRHGICEYCDGEYYYNVLDGTYKACCAEQEEEIIDILADAADARYDRLREERDDF